MASNPDRNANTPQSTRDGLHPSFKRSYDQADYEDDNRSAHSSSSSSASSSSTPSVPSCKRMRTSERNYAPTASLRSPSLESMRQSEDAQASASGSTPRQQTAATSSRVPSPPPGNSDDLTPALTHIPSAQASSASPSAAAPETPRAGNASDATSTTASSSSPGDNFRLSMERYTAFDSNISALRDDEVLTAAPAQAQAPSVQDTPVISEPNRPQLPPMRTSVADGRRPLPTSPPPDNAYRFSSFRPMRRTVISLEDDSDEEDMYRRLRPPPSPLAPGPSSSSLSTDTQAARSGPLIDLTMDVDTETLPGPVRTSGRQPPPPPSITPRFSETPQFLRPPPSDDHVRTSVYRPSPLILSHDVPPLPPPPPSLPSPVSRSSVLPSPQSSTTERRTSPSERRYSFPPVVPPLDGSFQRFVQGSSVESASRANPPPRDIPSASGTSTYNARAASVEAGYRDPHPRPDEDRMDSTRSYRRAAHTRSGAWNTTQYASNYPLYEMNPDPRLVDYLYPPSWYPPGYMPGYRPHSVYPYPYYTPPFFSGYGADPWGYPVPPVLPPPPPPLTYGLVPDGPPPEIPFDVYGETMLGAEGNLSEVERAMPMPGLLSESPSPTPEPSEPGSYTRLEAPPPMDRNASASVGPTPSVRSTSAVASSVASSRDVASASSIQASAPQSSSNTASASSPPPPPDTYASWRETAEDLAQQLNAMQPVLRRLADSTHSSRRIREFSLAMRSIQLNFARHLNTTLRSPPTAVRLSGANLSPPATSITNATRTATAATSTQRSARGNDRARRGREVTVDTEIDAASPASPSAPSPRGATGRNGLTDDRAGVPVSFQVRVPGGNERSPALSSSATADARGERRDSSRARNQPDEFSRRVVDDSSFESEFDRAMEAAIIAHDLTSDYTARRERQDASGEPSPRVRSPRIPSSSRAQTPRWEPGMAQPPPGPLSEGHSNTLSEDDSIFSTIMNTSDPTDYWGGPAGRRERLMSFPSASERSRAGESSSSTRSGEVHPRLLRDRARRNAMQSLYADESHDAHELLLLLDGREGSDTPRLREDSVEPSAPQSGITPSAPPAAGESSATAMADDESSTTLEGMGTRTPTGPPSSSRRNSNNAPPSDVTRLAINLNQYRDGPFRDTLLRTHMYGATRQGGRSSVSGESAPIRAPLPVYRPPSQPVEGLHVRRARPSAPRPVYVGPLRNGTLPTDPSQYAYSARGGRAVSPAIPRPDATSMGPHGFTTEASSQPPPPSTEASQYTGTGSAEQPPRERTNSAHATTSNANRARQEAMERYRARSLLDPTLEREFTITDTSFTGPARRRHAASRGLVESSTVSVHAHPSGPPSQSTRTAAAAAAAAAAASSSATPSGVRRRGGMHTWRMQNEEWLDTWSALQNDDIGIPPQALLRFQSMFGAVSRGTPDSVVHNLPSGTYGEWARPGETEERCPICFDDYQNSDPVLKLPNCSHWFHKPCLEQWLKNARTCPVCRSRVVDSDTVHGERYRVLDAGWHLRRARHPPVTYAPRAPSTPPNAPAIPYATLRTPSRSRVAPTVTTATTAGGSTTSSVSVTASPSHTTVPRPPTRTSTSIVVGTSSASTATTPATATASTLPPRRRSHVHTPWGSMIIGDHTSGNAAAPRPMVRDNNASAGTNDNASEGQSNTSRNQTPTPGPRSPDDFENPWL